MRKSQKQGVCCPDRLADVKNTRYKNTQECLHPQPPPGSWHRGTKNNSQSAYGYPAETISVHNSISHIYVQDPALCLMPLIPHLALFYTYIQDLTFHYLSHEI